MKRRDFLKFFSIGLAASLGTQAAKAKVCMRANLGTISAIYPVGAVYISTVSTNPADFFGFGTWQRFGNGRLLVGVDEADGDFNAPLAIGGAKTHTLTVAQIPSHTHEGIAGQASGQASGSGNDRPTDTRNIGSTGGGGAHNNLQPYITVFMWRRSA